MNKIEYKIRVSCMTYNHAKYIEDCMNGFCMQHTLFPFICTIIDDASTDGEQELIKSYINQHFDIHDTSIFFERDTTNAHFTLARHKENANCYFAVIYLKENHYSKHKSKASYITSWNQGIEYIALCEGDDFWTDPCKLQKQVDFLDKHKDFTMCFHAAEIKNETNTAPLTTCDEIFEGEYFSKDIFPGWVVPTASVVYRKSVVDNYQPLKKAEWLLFGDIVLFLKCTHTGKVWGMKDRMSVYRMTESGAVRTLNKNNHSIYYNKMCNHYKALMINFPGINKPWIRGYISSYHYTKFRHSNTLNDSIRNLFVAVYYSPKYVFQKLLRMHPKAYY